MRKEFRIVIPRFCIDVKNAESRAVAVVFKCLFVIGGAGVVFHNEIFAEQGRLFVDSRRDNGDFLPSPSEVSNGASETVVSPVASLT